MTFENAPVWIYSAIDTDKNTTLTGDGNRFVCERINIESQASLEKNPYNTEYHNGPQQITITIEGPLAAGGVYANGRTAGMTGFQSGQFIQIANLVWSGCHLAGRTVSIQPFAPVNQVVTFNVYGGVLEWSGDSLIKQGRSLNESYTTTEPTGGGAQTVRLWNEMIHSSWAGVTGSKIQTNPISLTYSEKADLVPSYRLGNIFPSAVYINSLTKEISIEGDNIQEFITWSGLDAQVAVSGIEMKYQENVWQNPSQAYAVSGTQLFDVSGKISSESISIQKDDIVKGRITAKQHVQPVMVTGPVYGIWDIGAFDTN